MGINRLRLVPTPGATECTYRKIDPTAAEIAFYGGGGDLLDPLSAENRVTGVSLQAITISSDSSQSVKSATLNREAESSVSSSMKRLDVETGR